MDWPRLLDRLLVPGCGYADIYLEKVDHALVSMEDDRLEKVIGGREEGAGLRAIFGFHTHYAHTNILDETTLSRLAGEIIRGSAAAGEPIRPPSGPAVPDLPGGGSLDTPRKIALVRLANEVARKHHPAVRQVLVTLSEKRQELSIFRPGGEAAGTRRETVMLVQTVAAKGDAMERGYEVLGRSEGSGWLDEAAVEELAKKSAGRAVMMLEAGSAPAGTMPVVISSEAGGTMVHEAIGHGLEKDLAGQGFSVYAGKIGARVASPLVSVADDPTLPGRRGSYAFDDEGTPSRRNILVDGGVLAEFISDILSAARYGGRPTGNGRRQSFRHPPIARMSNTMILPGADDPRDIVSDTGSGLYVVKMGGGQVNTVNGDFVFEVSEGYLLEGGGIGRPVRGALLIGNGPAVLREIDAVGRDLGFGVGTCGKDGQGVPVADAQPTLRIPRLTVGGRL